MDIASVLQQACQLDPRQPALVGVSGGPDSLCLAHNLWRLGQSILIAHLDHQLRPTSAQEAQTVQGFAEALRVPFIGSQEDVAVYATEHQKSLEEAARSVRYRFLFTQARQHGAQAVLVGHTANDQVESVLMHLLRGSGLAGLRGMQVYTLPNPWSDEIPLVRPLLGVWRREVLDYLDRYQLEPINDPSNQDTHFFRNRLRHGLLPTLEDYNPAVRQALWQTAEILRSDYDALQSLIDPIWNACLTQAGPGFLAFDLNALQRQPVGIQRNLLRRALARLRPGLRDIDFATVERILAFLHAPSRSRQTNLIAGLHLFIEDKHLWLAGWEADLPSAWPQVSADVDQNLSIPGELQLANEWLLSTRTVAAADQALAQAQQHTDPFAAWIDLSGWRPPLHVRTRRPGDRYQPLGLDGHSIKLSDLMINAKIPRRARAAWPLVCGHAADGSEHILWIPGFQPAEPVKLTPASSQVIYLSLQRDKSAY